MRDGSDDDIGVSASSRLWFATLVCCAAGAALAGPEWVPRTWSREDGPIEWAGFAAFFVGAGLALTVAWSCRSVRRRCFGALALATVLFFAAGEEISWGQRIFDVETPTVLVDGNRQDELNLHNIDGLQSKAVIGQLAIAGAGVLLPTYGRRRWARAGFPFFAGYLAYRGARVVGVAAGLGPADRNSEAAELLLGTGLLVVTTALLVHVVRADHEADAASPPTPSRVGGARRRRP